MPKLSRPRTGGGCAKQDEKKKKKTGDFWIEKPLYEEWERLCEWWGDGYCGVAHASSSSERVKSSLYMLLTRRAGICRFWTGDLSTRQVFNTSGFFFTALPSSLEQPLGNWAGWGFPALCCIECPTIFQCILVFSKFLFLPLWYLHLAGHSI